MKRLGRLLVRLLLAGAAAGGAYLAWVSALESPAAVDLLPAGAAAVVEVHDAAGLARRVSGTRFAAAFAQSDTRAWLDRTEPARAFDALRAEVGRITGMTPGRGIAFDFVGSDAALGWYPPAGAAAPAPWLAAGRLSVRAWAAAAALRSARSAGLGSSDIAREEVAGRSVYSLPVDAGRSLYLSFAGRVLVASLDRSLVVGSARAAADDSAAVTTEPAWRDFRTTLSSRGDIVAWVRDRNLLRAAPAAGGAGGGSVGAVLRAGTTVEIDIAADPGALQPTALPPGGTSEPLPAIALLLEEPLFFLSGRGPVPPALTELLQARQRAAAGRGAASAVPAPAGSTGHGFALAITGAAAGSGLFPAPRGVLVLGMASAAAAGDALALAFPPAARSAVAGGTRVLTTRESFPLASEFDLWGAAIGPRLVFATDPALIDALAAEAAAGNAEPLRPGPEWRVDAIGAVSFEKALPLLRPWSAPLSGLLTARWPGMPELTRDLGLLAALRTARVAVGSDGHRDRAALTLSLRDLP